MIPWFQPRFSGREGCRVISVFSSGYINDGPVTREFEREVARLVGRKYAVAVTSGTAALAVAFMSVRAYQVLVPDLTFIATANAARLAGAGVELGDVDPTTMCLNTTGEVADVIAAVEVNGNAPDYEYLGRYGNAIITDSCESLGVPGLARAGVASCLSFSPNKIITTGQGGMVLTDDGDVYDHLLELKDQGRRVRGTGGDDLHPTLGFNFKFTDVQAAIGLAQLSDIAERMATVRQRNQYYSDALKRCGVPTIANNGLWYAILSDQRDAIAANLRKHDIGCREFWRPLHTQVPYAYAVAEDFPHATRLSRRGLWLPSSFDLTSEQIDLIVNHIAEVARVSVSAGAA